MNLFVVALIILLLFTLIPFAGDDPVHDYESNSHND